MQHFSLIRLRLSSCESPPRVGGDGGRYRALTRRSDVRSQKKRRQQSRRGNTVSENPTGFSKKKPPYPTASGSAAKSQKSESFVYCPLSSVLTSRFCSRFLWDLAMRSRLLSRHPLQFLDTGSLLFIPSSVHHRSGIRLHVSRRSCVLFSDRSSRSSTGRDSLPAGTSDPDRSVVPGDLR
jgi:hypothetical protein